MFFFLSQSIVLVFNVKFIITGKIYIVCPDADYTKINVFYTKKLRQLAGMKSDQITNNKLYSQTSSYPLGYLVRKYRLRWAGHVARMEDTRILKMVLFGEIEGRGTRPPGRPRYN